MITIPRTLLSFALLAALASSLTADELLEAPDDAPQYELTGIRRDSDRFGGTILVVDYKCVRNSKLPFGRISIAGKTNDGKLTGFSVDELEQTGQLRVGLRGILLGESDFEVYLVMDALGDKKYMVSNAVRIGNPGPATTPRPWTEEEIKAAERAKLATVPPAEIPDGYLPVTASTTLLPGMPIKAGSFAEWYDAEVISLEPVAKVRVRFADQETLEDLPREKWLAVDPKIVARAESDPTRFKPSAVTLPDSLLIIPKDCVPLKDDVALPPGTPLLLDGAHTWRQIFVISADDEVITVRYAGYEDNWDEEQPRSKCVIKQHTLKSLSRPAAVKKLADNLITPAERIAAQMEANRKTQEGMMAAHRRSAPGRTAALRPPVQTGAYPITIPLPKGAQLLPDDLELEPGTALAACWAGKWQPLTVIRQNEDGTVYVHWDEWSSSSDSDLPRDELIIEKNVARQLRRQASHAAESEDLTTVLRTWTDVTGKHKIEAWFVRKTDSEVTLKTDAGRELTLPIERLSDEDREILTGEQPGDDNPFK